MPDDTPWNSLANHVYQLQKQHKDDNDRYEVLAARLLDLERKVEAMGDVNQLQWSWNNFLRDLEKLLRLSMGDVW